MPEGLAVKEIYEYFGAPLGVAFLFWSLTAFALSLMTAKRKETLALWLMGAGDEHSWSQSYLNMFDAIFGQKYFSLRCLLLSCFLSTVFVFGFWGLMVWSGTVSTRGALGSWSLTEAIIIGVAINMIADYISLIETRYLLGLVSKMRAGPLQATLLILDLLFTGSIILIVIWIVQTYGLPDRNYDDSFSIILAFSIFQRRFIQHF